MLSVAVAANQANVAALIMSYRYIYIAHTHRTYTSCRVTNVAALIMSYRNRYT